jgi:hypothetical protein
MVNEMSCRVDALIQLALAQLHGLRQQIPEETVHCPCQARHVHSGTRAWQLLQEAE